MEDIAVEAQSKPINHDVEVVISPPLISDERSQSKFCFNTIKAQVLDNYQHMAYNMCYKYWNNCFKCPALLVE